MKERAAELRAEARRAPRRPWPTGCRRSSAVPVRGILLGADSEYLHQAIYEQEDRLFSTVCRRSIAGA
jgi:hypothetical protein